MTREEIYSRFEELDKRASLGGGVDKIEKQHAQGKMPVATDNKNKEGRIRYRIQPIVNILSL